MRKLLIFAVAMLAAPVANATTIQTFSVVVSGSITGALFPSPGTITGTGTAVLDDSGVLTVITTTDSVGNVDPGGGPLPLDQTQDSTNTNYGTLTGLVLNPYMVDTTIDTCVDNIPSPFCSLVLLGYVTTNTGGAGITFDITPGGTTIFSSILDTSALYNFTPGAIILNTTTTLTAVPEPGTAALFLAGLAALATFSRRRPRA